MGGRLDTVSNKEIHYSKICEVCGKMLEDNDAFYRNPEWGIVKWHCQSCWRKYLYNKDHQSAPDLATKLMPAMLLLLQYLIAR